MKKIHTRIFYLSGILAILGIILFLSRPVHAIFELPHYALDDSSFLLEYNNSYPECDGTWCLRLNIPQITIGALKNTGDTGNGFYTFMNTTAFQQGVDINTSSTPPTCTSDTRGTLWVTQGILGVADTLQFCTKTILNTYTWKSISLI